MAAPPGVDETAAASAVGEGGGVEGEREGGDVEGESHPSGRCGALLLSDGVHAARGSAAANVLVCSTCKARVDAISLRFEVMCEGARGMSDDEFASLMAGLLGPS